jgi:hypothetical protein
MLGGRAPDQNGQVFAGDSTDLDAKALGLSLERRPVGEACCRRVEEPKQAAWRTVVYVHASLDGHHAALGFAGPDHSDKRMTFATYTLATEGTQVATTDALEETFS